MPTTATTAARAADALIAYWMGAPGQDMLTRDLCRRLAEAVERDSPVPLAGLVEADPARGAAMAREAVRGAAERSPAVRTLCTALASEPMVGGARDVVQTVNAVGSSGPIVTVGGNFSGTVSLAPSPDSAPPSPAPAPRQAKPKTKILFAAAQPVMQVRIACEREAREVRDEIDRSRNRRRIRFSYRPAITIERFTGVLYNLCPRVVHFSGHGAPTGELCFETPGAGSAPVTPNALSNLFAEFRDQIECVILNACYSEVQARAIARHIPFVVGMKEAIRDRAAIAFSVGFYQAFSAGRTVPEAFRHGRNMIELKGFAGELTPMLIKRKR